MKNVTKAKIDKFVLYAFNHLTYDQKINGLLALNIFFGLLKYYTPNISIKKVNLWVFRKRFSSIIFDRSANGDIIENFILFEKLRNLPISKFNNYN